MMQLPLGPPPRQFKRKSNVGGNRIASSWIPRIFMLPHTLAGLGLLGWTLFLFATFLVGKSYPGSIVSRNDCHRSSKNTSCKITYEYLVEHTVVRNELSMSVSDYENTSTGQPIEVRALGSNPGFYPLPIIDGKFPGLLYFLPFFTLIWNTFVGAFNYFLWYLPWLEKKLVREGCPASGAITKIAKFGHKDGSRKVCFDFVPSLTSPDHFSGQTPTESGTGRTQGSMLVSREFLAKGPLKVGDKVTVLYDQNKPSRSIIYDFSSYEALKSGSETPSEDPAKERDRHR